MATTQITCRCGALDANLSAHFPAEPSSGRAAFLDGSNGSALRRSRRSQTKDGSAHRPGRGTIGDTVKSVVILLFIFGCVAVGFAIYWARRAVNPTNEPVVALKESGGLTEAVRRLYALETTPDDYRMSSSQRDYVRTNLDEFVSLHRDEMETMVNDALERFRATKASAGEQLCEEELAKAEKSVRTIMAHRFAKAWCEVRGVA